MIARGFHENFTLHVLKNTHYDPAPIYYGDFGPSIGMHRIFRVHPLPPTRIAIPDTSYGAWSHRRRPANQSDPSNDQTFSHLSMIKTKKGTGPKADPLIS